jgi:hypothetical protein
MAAGSEGPSLAGFRSVGFSVAPYQTLLSVGVTSAPHGSTEQTPVESRTRNGAPLVLSLTVLHVEVRFDPLPEVNLSTLA